MSPGDYQVRRATVDDRPWLVPLWQSLDLAADELDRRLTEFQVIETADQQPLGALGLQAAGRHARIHSEAFADFGFADHFRPRLWDRIQALAQAQGIVWIWTLEESPFWSRNGFHAPSAELRGKMPAEWQTERGRWSVIQLREDTLAGIDLDAHVEALMRQERERTSRSLQRGKTLKKLATLAAVILAIFVMGAVVYLVWKNPNLLRR